MLATPLYLKRRHNFWKIIISYTNHLFSSFLFDKPYRIYLSSFKGFTSKVKNEFIGTKQQKNFFRRPNIKIF